MVFSFFFCMKSLNFLQISCAFHCIRCNLELYSSFITIYEEWGYGEHLIFWYPVFLCIYNKLGVVCFYFEFIGFQKIFYCTKYFSLCIKCVYFLVKILCFHNVSNALDISRLTTPIIYLLINVSWIFYFIKIVDCAT